MDINSQQPLQPAAKVPNLEKPLRVELAPPEIKEPTPQPNQQQKENTEQDKQPPADQLKKDIDAFNKVLESRQTHLKFHLHEKLNEYFIQVVNNQNEVVKEIPPKKLMDMAAKVQEMIGIMVDEKI